MTLCGLLLGIEVKDAVPRMKERDVTAIDVIISPPLSYHRDIGQEYEIRLYEKNRTKGKPTLFPDRIGAQYWTYSFFRDGDYKKWSKSFDHPTSINYAFRVALLLERAGIDVTVNSKPVSIARSEYEEYFRNVAAYLATGGGA